MHISFDATDLKLLAMLQEDAGRSTAELAEAMNISQSACWRRIQHFKDAGIIRRQVALLDRERIGLSAQIFAEVKISAHGRANLAEFSDAIRAFPEVLECYVVLGRVDFLLRIVAADIQAYERFFFEKLSRLPGVLEINSIVALSDIKSTTVLPLTQTRKADSSKLATARDGVRQKNVKP
jgi:Lrp/AsnC family transcriptional regulator